MERGIKREGEVQRGKEAVIKNDGGAMEVGQVGNTVVFLAVIQCCHGCSTSSSVWAVMGFSIRLLNHSSLHR